MKRLSLWLVLIWLVFGFAGCGEADKTLASTLIEHLSKNASYLKDVTGKDNGIEDPGLWAEDFVAGLEDLISRVCRSLEGPQDQIVLHEDRWNEEFRPFLERIKQGDVIAFKNNLNDAFKLAVEGLRENDAQEGPAGAGSVLGVEGRVPIG